MGNMGSKLLAVAVELLDPAAGEPRSCFHLVGLGVGPPFELVFCFFVGDHVGEDFVELGVDGCELVGLAVAVDGGLDLAGLLLDLGELAPADGAEPPGVERLGLELVLGLPGVEDGFLLVHGLDEGLDLGVGGVLDALEVLLVGLLDDLGDEDVLLEDALLLLLVVVDELALAVLDALVPVALVDGAVVPEHLAVALAQVVEEVAPVDVAAGPLEDAVPGLLVVEVLALVVVVLRLPHALAVPQPVLELALVHAVVGPPVLALSLGLAVGVVALVLVAVLEVLLAVAVLQVVLELALVHVPVGRQVRAVPFHLAEPPLAGVLAAIRARPLAFAVLHPVHPLSLVRLPVRPHVLPVPLRLPVQERPLVLRLVREPLEAFAVLHPVLPSPNVHLPILRVQQHSVAVLLVVLNQPEVVPHCVREVLEVHVLLQDPQVDVLLQGSIRPHEGFRFERVPQLQRHTFLLYPGFEANLHCRPTGDETVYSSLWSSTLASINIYLLQLHCQNYSVHFVNFIKSAVDMEPNLWNPINYDLRYSIQNLINQLRIHQFNLMHQIIKYSTLLSFATVYPMLLASIWHHFHTINNSLLIVLSLQVCHLVSSLLANSYFAFFYYIDHPYFNQWKIETKEFPWKVNQAKWIEKRNQTLLAIARNFMIGVGFSVFDTFVMGAGYRCGQDLPSYAEVAVQLMFCILMDDFFFYWGHRLLHHPLLYSRIHKEHHEYTVTVSISAEYAHPTEYVLGNILPVFAGPKLLGSSMHLITLLVWLTFKIFRAASIHSGYSFPWSPFQATEEFHSLHHSLNTGNYATGLRVWDKLMKTEISLL